MALGHARTLTSEDSIGSALRYIATSITRSAPAADHEPLRAPQRNSPRRDVAIEAGLREYPAPRARNNPDRSRTPMPNKPQIRALPVARIHAAWPGAGWSCA